MSYFHYKNNQLYVEEYSLLEVAHQVSTPCYVYSRIAIEKNWHNFHDSFGKHPHLVCYAVKANSNIAILSMLSRLGSGFDIVSLGELERVLYSGADPKKIIFSGVGKTDIEITRALQVGIYCFNVESESELYRIEKIAQELKIKAPIALRVNPDIDAHTHPYISTGLRDNKFGIAITSVIPLFEYAANSSSLLLLGIDCHIGSQLTELNPILESMQRIHSLIDSLNKKSISIQHINMGGGLGIPYQDEVVPEIADYVKILVDYFPDKKLIIEPGRAIVANAGILLTKVEYIKKQGEKSFAIVDAGMNDLLRPAMYSAYHKIQAVEKNENTLLAIYDVVGPICETSDFLAKERELSIKEGDYLAVMDAGAYGFSMSSQYNSRPRAAEVMIDHKKMHCIRTRETIEDLFRAEKIICD